MFFIHSHLSENTGLQASRCAECDRVVAFSPRAECLAIAEHAHTQAAHTPTPQPQNVTLSPLKKTIFSA